MPSKSIPRNTQQVKVERLRIVRERDLDSQPEMSGDPDYEKEDQARIDSWKRDEWFYLGVYVECNLVVAGTLQHIRTPGIWGVEDDSDPGYFKELAEQEYDELLTILGHLGVDKSQVPALSTAKEIDR